MPARRRTAAWASRCLLAVALLFGVVLMHALGHPAEHAAPSPAGTHATHTTHAAPRTAASSPEHASTAQGSHATHHAPAHGAGATAVCLAVLGAGVGVILLKRAAGRHLPAPDVPSPTARPTYALRAIPPPAPPGSLLTHLSLSRI